jgi:hypothetical protein
MKIPLTKSRKIEVKEMEGQISLITDGNKDTSRFKSILDEKEREIKNLKDKLKIPLFQLT